MATLHWSRFLLLAAFVGGAFFMLPGGFGLSEKHLFISILILLAAVFSLFQGQRRIDRPAWIAFLIIFISHIASWLFSTNPIGTFFGDSGRAWGFFFQISGVIFALLILKDATYWKAVFAKFHALGITVFLICLFAIIQWLGLIPWLPLDVFQGRIDATFGNPNTFALYLLLNTPFLLHAAAHETQRKWKIFLGITFFFLMIALILTGSRIGLAVFVLELLFVGWEIMEKQRLVAIGLTALIIFAGGIFLFDKNLQERFLPKKENLISLETRLMVWKDTIPLIQAKPLFGYGQDQYFYAFQKDSHSPLLHNALLPDRAHNIVLDLLVERGFFGLLGMVFLLILLWKKFLEKLHAADAVEKKFLYTLVAVVGAYFLYNFFNFTDLLSVLYTWIAFALILGNDARAPSSNG